MCDFSLEKLSVFRWRRPYRISSIFRFVIGDGENPETRVFTQKSTELSNRVPEGVKSAQARGWQCDFASHARRAKNARKRKVTRREKRRWRPRRSSRNPGTLDSWRRHVKRGASPSSSSASLVPRFVSPSPFRFCLFLRSPGALLALLSRVPNVSRAFRREIPAQVCLERRKNSVLIKSQGSERNAVGRFY